VQRDFCFWRRVPAQAARMLKEHGRLIDAPEDTYDSNFLTRTFLGQIKDDGFTNQL